MIWLPLLVGCRTATIAVLFSFAGTPLTEQQSDAASVNAVMASCNRIH
jgi:hypothetical protein